jgi:pimeloyl-ACP methyl ester carboxylesterase
MQRKSSILYLHGLGASPESTKRRLVEQRFGALGFRVYAPDLNLPSLNKLSVAEAVAEVERSVSQRAEDRLFVIGSSFGGFLAMHGLQRLGHNSCSHVVGVALLSPVLMPFSGPGGLLKPEVEASWAQRGSYPLVTFDDGSTVSVHYRFLEELRLFDAQQVTVSIPTLVLHGIHDTVVPSSQSELFARDRPEVKVRLLDDDHQLSRNPEVFLDALMEFVGADAR